MSPSASPSVSSQHVPTCALVNLGCRVNHAEIEAMRLALEDANIPVADAKHAQVVVVNTCAVTGEAEAKSRKAIRRLASMPSVQSVYVTGCAATLFEEAFASLAKNVVLVSDKRRIPECIKREAEAAPSQNASQSTINPQLQSAPVPSRMRREIKIQDGCNNTCSYCIVRVARGASRSVPVDKIIKQAERASKEGIGEIVLTGINLGQFRLDAEFAKTAGTPADATSLATLIRHLLEEVPLGRVRLSSIEPTDIDASLIDLMARNPERIAPYLHVPLQSGSTSILQAMKRPYTAPDYDKVVAGIRKALPHVALATDIIVGFPGESKDNFEETYAFAKRMEFSKIHLFRYSPRPGTRAAQRKDQIPPEIKAQRAHKLQRLADEMRANHAQNLLGKKVQVYVESPGRGKSEGLFEANVPQEIPVGTFVTAVVTEVAATTLICQ